VATSSSPFHSLSHGDEDIAAPILSQRGQFQDAPFSPRIANPLQKLESWIRQAAVLPGWGKL
jgi:hypothetical protein